MKGEMDEKEAAIGPGNNCGRAPAMYLRFLSARMTGLSGFRSLVPWRGALVILSLSRISGLMRALLRD